MKLFRIAVAVAWCAVLALTVRAILVLGIDQAGDTFIADFGHAWRAQFNGDFSAHLLLMAAWIFHRERNLATRVLFAIFAVLFGGVFSLAYVLVASFRAQGSVAELLSGRRPGA